MTDIRLLYPKQTRHCEARCDEAIKYFSPRDLAGITGLRRFARNDAGFVRR
jgi:hypothetical protein